MVAQVEKYFGTPFMGYCGVTQGDPPSTTIFNVAVDEFLRHCFTLGATMEEAVELGRSGTKGFGQDVQQLLAHFYADYGLLSLTWTECLQQKFDALTELLDHVVLRANEEKMIIMD